MGGRRGSSLFGLEQNAVVILGARIVMSGACIVILGLDPRITLRPYPSPSSHFLVVRAVGDVRVEPEQIRVPFVSPVGMTLVRHVMAGPGPAIYRRTVLE